MIDPESGLDGIRNVVITGGEVRAIRTAPLSGKRVIDARVLMVTPRFIYLHWHGRDPASDA